MPGQSHSKQAALFLTECCWRAVPVKAPPVPGDGSAGGQVMMSMTAKQASDWPLLCRAGDLSEGAIAGIVVGTVVAVIALSCFSGKEQLQPHNRYLCKPGLQTYLDTSYCCLWFDFKSGRVLFCLALVQAFGCGRKLSCSSSSPHTCYYACVSLHSLEK